MSYVVRLLPPKEYRWIYLLYGSGSGYTSKDILRDHLLRRRTLCEQWYVALRWLCCKVLMFDVAAANQSRELTTFNILAKSPRPAPEILHQNLMRARVVLQ